LLSEEGHEFLVIHGPKGSYHTLPISTTFQSVTILRERHPFEGLCVPKT
jgi:hypothetical protein